MPNWQGSTRRERLPANWESLRADVLRRDRHQCTHRSQDGARCTARATDVDHVVAGDDHSKTNLRSLCSDHHQRKSSSEGGRGRAAKRRQISQRFRRVEDHPGKL